MTTDVVDVGDGIPLTIPDLIEAFAARGTSAVMLVCDDDVLTYSDANARSERLARSLLANGVGKGTHVGLLFPNGSEFVVAFLAAARIGAISLPLSTFSTALELRSLLIGADVEVLLAANSYRSHDFPTTLKTAFPEMDISVGAQLRSEEIPFLRRIWFSGLRGTYDPFWSLEALVTTGDSTEPEVLKAVESGVAAGDRLVIVHTSGSTSEPKGVIHTHGSLLRHLDNLNQIRRYRPHDVLFANSPFFWIGGFAFSLLGTMIAGGKLLCSNATTACDVLDLLERERPTMVNGFAQSVAYLGQDPTFANRDLTSIRRGNLYPIMPDDIRPDDPELRHAMLGMTEAGSVCLLSGDESDQPEERRGSFGRPAPGMQTRVVDPESNVDGSTGELWLRGPFMMEGYYGRERDQTFDSNGWYHTGDLVSVDSDGFFYFKGRLGDMIKTGGANVAPAEIQKAILEGTGHHSYVVGLDDPDRGQLVGAVIVGSSLSAGDEAVIRSSLEQRLSAYKLPRRYLLLQEREVPTLSSGKVDLRALKGLFDGA